MKLDRRWWVAIAVAVIAVIAVVLSNTVFNRTSEECKPVKDLLAYNQSQNSAIEEKTKDSNGIPSQTEEMAYRAWADGLAQRAQNVSSPDYAFTAGQLATLADDFVSRMDTLRAQSQSRAPGAPTPPVVFEMDALSTQISQKLSELSDACK